MATQGNIPLVFPRVKVKDLRPGSILVTGWAVESVSLPTAGQIQVGMVRYDHETNERYELVKLWPANMEIEVL